VSINCNFKRQLELGTPERRVCSPSLLLEPKCKKKKNRRRRKEKKHNETGSFNHTRIPTRHGLKNKNKKVISINTGQILPSVYSISNSNFETSLPIRNIVLQFIQP
jgi:hypothetical protein